MAMKSSWKRPWGWIVVAALALVTAYAGTRITAPDTLAIHGIRPEGVMGTDCDLRLRAPLGAREKAAGALEDAETRVRALEARFSTYIEASEVSRLNAAPGGAHPVSPELLDVVWLSLDVNMKSDGAFDPTCRPLVQLWKACEGELEPPTPVEILEARGESSWALFRPAKGMIEKGGASAQLDLGGIAKGYAIDQATEILERSGLPGGMVDIGGDLRVFGKGPGPGDAWPVEVRHPVSGRRPLFQLRVKDVAVCTSGDYQRFVVIGGRRYSHIIDPRTGRPAAVACSVTVIAPTAAEADAWATALSVLGPEGLARIEEQRGVEACVVTGEGDALETAFSSGFRSFLAEQR
jgi:thiamine biosynthesis lipoprotein